LQRDLSSSLLLNFQLAIAMNNSSASSSSNLSQGLVILTTLFVVIGTVIYFNLPKSSASPASSSENKSNKQSKDEKRERAPSNLEDKYPAGKMSIYFASQTGTAEGFARTIMAEAHKVGFEAKMIDLEDFEPEQVQNARLAVFLVATYGEGDPTDNSAKFYKWLKNEDQSLPSDFLSSLQFTVFGLGNSQYENYNKMGRDFNEKLALLGAERVFDYGEGDDDATLEDDFENWKGIVMPALAKRYRPSSSIPIALDDAISEKVHLTYDVRTSKPVSSPKIPSSNLISTTSKYFFSCHPVTVTKNKEMRTPADGGHTVHMEFDLTNTGVKYFTADNLAVVPNNNETVVNQFASTCGGFDLDQYISIVPAAEAKEESIPFKHPFPNPCSLRDVFTLYLDIDSIPRKSALERLIPYVTDENQASWLKELVSKENREVYNHSIEEEGRTYASILSNELSSCVIPLADLFHLIPLIQPRYYTISSSSSCHPNSVHLTVSVVERKAPSGRVIKGFCSSFLYDMSVAQRSQCRVFSRESLFRLPEDVRTPIIMIGPGSGIAPMRALLQEREFQAKKAGVPFTEMTNILYFGCKGRNFDFIYQDELEDSLNRGVLTSLKVAFSREQAKKVYVQNLMSEPENASELVRLVMDQGAHIFVCGGTGMGTTVGEVFTQIIAQEKGDSNLNYCESYRIHFSLFAVGISHDEASAILKAKHKNKMYKQELWSV
jgi:NADPH-ferrihemoprotein reductase